MAVVMNAMINIFTSIIRYMIIVPYIKIFFYAFEIFTLSLKCWLARLAQRETKKGDDRKGSQCR